ncbi:hypothetical protein SK128_003032 [Halocaridina rubra]|uniref:Uncharacterized protein n=1 Tax=Halocaridina rubra TaxID=373956 RepID=A0AAN8WY34_HALRR
MKYFTLALSVLCALAYVRTQESAYCRCALFVSSRHTEIMVYELAPVNIDTCESHNQCQNRCATEISQDTNDLDLWSMWGNDTVGQAFCTELYSHFFFYIHNSYIHGYYEMCGGPWEYTGQDSQQPLCCDMGQQEHCIA